MGILDAFRCKYQGCHPPVVKPNYADPDMPLDVTTMLMEDRERWVYLKKVCGATDLDSVATVLRKVSETLQRMRGENNI